MDHYFVKHTFYFYPFISDGLTSSKLFRLSGHITNAYDLRSLGIDGLRVEANKVDTLIHNHPNDISSAAYDLLRDWSKTQPNKIIALERMLEALQRVKMSSLITEIR